MTFEQAVNALSFIKEPIDTGRGLLAALALLGVIKIENESQREEMAVILVPDPQGRLADRTDAMRRAIGNTNGLTPEPRAVAILNLLDAYGFVVVPKME